MPSEVHYEPIDLEKLQKHCTSLKDKESYDAFIQYGHDLLKRIGADPYHVRMALTKGYSMMEFGSRAAYQHFEKPEGIEIGLLIRAADIGSVDQRHRLFEHTFKPAGGMVFIHPLSSDWKTFPQHLLALNEVAMREEYARIKDTALVEIRKDSGTTNEALKYAVVNGVPVSSMRTTQYWVFQGNPKFYDTVGALRAKAVRTWTVTAHTDKIQPGDKAIIWVTGQRTGCYALATITTMVLEMAIDEADHAFVLDPSPILKQKRVKIQVDHDFSDRPVEATELRALAAMADFKGGNQGTTFTATKEQYEAILALANKHKGTMSIPLNRILYGPPGTGKTFHTIGKALEVCDPTYYAANKDNDDALRKRFNELLIKDPTKAEGQIAFCTFHQSYSYEDFVEGIKPVEVAEDSVQPLRYHTRPGILKEMARRSMSRSAADGPKRTNTVSFTPEQYDKAEVFKLSLGDSQNPEDQLIYDYCIKNNCVAIGFMYQHDLTGKSEQEVRTLPLQADQSSYHSKAMNFFSQYLNEGDIVVVTKGLYVVRAIGIVTGPYRYDPKSPIGYPHFRDVKWLMVDAEVPYEELYTRQFSQQSIYKMKKSDLKRDFFVRSSSPGPELGEPKNFVLIIDEINRGNVAGIFGELITLVEENKRKGRPEALEVTLPYSQEPFSIPDNLYIIGTMNTADRSVEALDAALRRRFSFVPMMPAAGKLKKLQSTRIDINALLQRMNERVVQLLDEDHQIGHSHFWDLHKEADPIPALRRVFADKIIPQLEEYFHRDRSKLRLVLGPAFVQRVDAPDNLFLGDGDDLDFEPRPTFRVTPQEQWSEEAFRAIHG
jgi:hypothetical protein